jgi:hypothetical protein
MGGDKEFLFHVALMPFLAVMDPPVAGRLALAAINAAIFTIVAALSIEVLGWTGFLVPVWMYLAVPPFLSRVIRLRPELLALVIILAAVASWPRHRALLLGLMAFLFTLTYTAFHVFLALCFIWFVCEWLRSNKPPAWALATFPLIGSALGFAARPHVLGYVRVWYAQNVLFFLYKDRLDVGEEIFAPDRTFLLRCVPWVLGLLALLLAAGQRNWSDRRFIALAASALFFLILFLPMARLITYVVPLATLAIVASLQRPMTTWRGIAVAAILVIGIFAALAALRIQTDYVPRWIFSRDASPELFWERMGRLLPPDAKVATSWGNADLFAYWAPQARYLNLLDPIFMFASHPHQQVAWMRIVRGAEPDVASAVGSTLASDFLLINPIKVSGTLQKRLSRDPRWSLIEGSENGLYALQPAIEGFVLDWKTGDGRPYPRAADERGRRFEGFVTIERLGRQRCEFLVHDDRPRQKPSSWEFAPYGSGLLRVDGRAIVATLGTPGAILGQGFSFVLPPSTATRRMEVLTCRAADGVGGFYLVERQ